MNKKRPQKEKEMDAEDIARILQEYWPQKVIKIPTERQEVCLSDDEILQFIDDEVSEREKIRIIRHLGKCEECHDMWFLIYRGGHPEEKEIDSNKSLSEIPYITESSKQENKINLKKYKKSVVEQI